MARAYGLGTLPGADVPEALDIIVSETGEMPHLPIMPERGLGYDRTAMTAAMIGHLSIDRGPRGWVLLNQPRLATVRIADHLARDLDLAQALWPPIPRVKMQLSGPLSLACDLELADGHRVLTDPGALRDLAAALIDGIVTTRQELQRRFSVSEVVVQLDEPWLSAIAAGKVPGTNDFDTIRAIHPQDLHDELQSLVDEVGGEVLLNQSGQVPLWEVSPCQVLVDTARVAGTAQLDGLGTALAEKAVGLGVAAAEVAGDPRGVAIRLARLAEELGVDPARLSNMDVYPAGRLGNPAAAYAGVQELAGILTRDAGDL
ncbi:hypothetical protein C3B44_06710 [Corynebacterium yudongzhengii]|uniref:Methionine synthase n=1 Tax=Corynebacterium yudongzhengii TaxID=2080740 RepID=A0A2U1T9A5_9CORY|nr:hypothetical protein [Corynebacterium yudongzhengii]AWB82082.1 hypothetical protein C3B44_06710 [Corynebacterium yudongzhengii]PWC02586.1 hypothetical protein DF222_01180 [Corynebacterium yudongzhengii]